MRDFFPLRWVALAPLLAIACGGPEVDTAVRDHASTGVPPACPVAPLSETLVRPAATDPQSLGVELGVKFRVRGDAVVTGVRFHRAAGNDGPHVGRLWTAAGVELASVTFAAPTDVGWQTATFSSPVPVTPGQTYVVSYFAPTGGFSYRAGDLGWTSSVGDPDGPVTLLADGEDGGNGVYRYGGGFPNRTFRSANYFVEPLVDDTTPPSAPTGLTGARTTDEATLSWTPSTDGGFAVQAQVIYRDGQRLAEVDPTATSYVDGLAGPTLDRTYEVRGRDFCGNESPLSAPLTLTVPGGGPTTQTLRGDAAPVSTVVSDGIPIWLGTRFTSTRTGTVTAIRFWRDVPDPQGAPYRVQLWSADDGWRLATGTAQGATAPGWQEIVLDTPVAIDAYREYMAVYFSSGSWSNCTGYPAAPASDLTAVSFAYVYDFASLYGFPRLAAVDGCVDVRITAGAAVPPPPPPPAPAPRVTQSVFGPAAPGGFRSVLSQNLTLGAKVRASVDGFMTGVRFYNQSAHPTYTASLYALDGTLLAQKTETTTAEPGWRAIEFDVDVPVTANTTYVAAYHIPSSVPFGYFQYDFGGLSSSIVNGPLELPGSGLAGGNGVWANGLAFPDRTYVDSNYFVDVLFTTQPPPPPATSVNLYGDADPFAGYSASPTPVELGVKIVPIVNGQIEAIRFFRQCGNAAGFDVYLYAPDGTVLATSSTPGVEAMHGWQTVPLVAPVPVTAGLTYTASYHASNGCFTFDPGAFLDERRTDFLRAPSSAAAGGNGVFRYGPGGVRPVQSANRSDYYVDVEFLPTP